nr:MAG TPA: hypothetical protein [Caudoviricetes sp.]
MLKNIKFKELTLAEATFMVLKEGFVKISKTDFAVLLEFCNGCGYSIRLTKVKGVGLVLTRSNKMSEHYVLKANKDIEELLKIINYYYEGNTDIQEILYLPNDLHKCVALNSLGSTAHQYIWNKGYLSLSVSPSDFKDETSIRNIFVLSKIFSIQFIGDKGGVAYQVS